MEVGVPELRGGRFSPPLRPSDDHFVQIMCIRKGKRLVARILPFLSPEQAADVLTATARNLPFLIKKDAQDEVMLRRGAASASSRPEVGSGAGSPPWRSEKPSPRRHRRPPLAPPAGAALPAEALLARSLPPPPGDGHQPGAAANEPTSERGARGAHQPSPRCCAPKQGAAALLFLAPPPAPPLLPDAVPLSPQFGLSLLYLVLSRGEELQSAEASAELPQDNQW